MELVDTNSEDTTNLKWCTFCINCNTILFEESTKSSKIFRSVSSLKDGVSTGKTEISIQSALSLLFNFQGDNDHFPSDTMAFVCQQCGELIELAFNAILDFTELTKQGSKLHEMLDKTKLPTALLSLTSPLLPVIGKNQPDFQNSRALSEKSTKIVALKRSQRLMKSAKKTEKLRTQRIATDDERQVKNLEATSRAKHICSLCRKPFFSETLLQKHEGLFHKHNSDNGSEKQSLRQSIMRKSSKENSKKDLKNEQAFSVTDKSPYFCTICELEIDKFEFQNHLKIHEETEQVGDNTLIPTCENSYNDDEEVGDMVNPDLPFEKLKCKLCGEDNITSIVQLKEHYNKNHPLVSILTEADLHSNIEDNNFTKGGFNENGDDGENAKSTILTLREATHAGRLIFNCNVCNKQFIRHDHIKLHVRVHTGEKPFICTVTDCGKAFSDPRGLAYHEITHSNERPYCCKFCGKTFKRLHHLNDHERNHNDVPRRFVCQVCEKTFKHRKHLNSHFISIHSTSKEHQCDFCCKSFNRKDNLRQHVKKVHGKPPSKPEERLASVKGTKSLLKVVSGEIGSTSTSAPLPSTRKVVFHGSAGGSINIIGTTAVASSNESNNAGIVINAQEATMTSPELKVTVPAETVKDSNNAAGGVSTAMAAPIIPLASAITDQSAIDQIVYMHL